MTGDNIVDSAWNGGQPKIWRLHNYQVSYGMNMKQSDFRSAFDDLVLVEEEVWEYCKKEQKTLLDSSRKSIEILLGNPHTNPMILRHRLSEYSKLLFQVRVERNMDLPHKPDPKRAVLQ